MELKILSLNCWGIPIISKDRKIRFKAVGEHLAMICYDFVCLQEVWSIDDFEVIKVKVENNLPYSHYFYSGVVGSGICIFSKYSIVDIFFHQWSVNGYIHKIQHGDWFGGKGVGLCCFKVKNFSINVYCAHLHAEYNSTIDEYHAHRVLQAYDTAQFIKMTSGGVDLSILVGDLNTEPGSLAYRILVEKANLRDSFQEANEILSELKECGTNESCKNSYTKSSLLKLKTPGKRIDYIMFACNKDRTQMKIESVDYCHPLPNRIPGLPFSYSDHEGICATLKIVEYISSANNSDNKTVNSNSLQQKDQESALNEGIKICDISLKKISYHKRYYWFASVFLLCLVITTIAAPPPFDMVILYHVIRIILTGLLCFTIAMASLWCKIETNAILAGKIAMEVCLKQFIFKKEQL